MKILSHKTGSSTLIVLILFFSILPGLMAAEMPYTRSSAAYFNEAELRQSIREASAGVASDYGIPESLFNFIYPEYEARVHEISRPYIVKRFRWLEEGLFTKPAPGTLAFQKRRTAYANELRRGVTEAMLSDSVLVGALLTRNESDRILIFHSDIVISGSGTIRVAEEITVYNGDGSFNSENDEIKRGIVRTFPTVYRDAYGLLNIVPFRIIEITRDGQPEPYHTERAENGTVVYLGDASYYLDRGLYHYRIEYETDDQLIFHPDKDEFYWNVTGNGWSFVIEKAGCSIRFPEKAEITEFQCYTGAQGSTGNLCSATQVDRTQIHFASQGALSAWEGLTVAVSIQKGVLAEPSSTSRFLDLVADNYILPVLIVVLLLLFIFNYISWVRVGRDPAAGTIIPQFSPPAEMSPADTGYLLHQKFRPELFTAALVDCAVQRAIDIEAGSEGKIFKSRYYRFTAPAEPPEGVTLGRLEQWYGFSADDLYDEKAVKGEYNPSLEAVLIRFKAALEGRLLIRKGIKNTFKGMFALNQGPVGFGVLLIILSAVAAGIILMKYSTPVLILYSVLILVLCILVQVVFGRIMSAYTPEGRKVLDHVLGFKMYLETAEQRRFDALNPPEIDLSLFEKYLPYAIALGCENEWASKFDNVLQQAQQRGYQPVYFRGFGTSSFSASEFTGGLGSSFSGTISSSSTAPSQSSGGSGGGGSSGGGGGGGGGGGW